MVEKKISSAEVLTSSALNGPAQAESVSSGVAVLEDLSDLEELEELETTELELEDLAWDELEEPGVELADMEPVDHKQGTAPSEVPKPRVLTLVAGNAAAGGDDFEELEELEELEEPEKQPEPKPVISTGPWVSYGNTERDTINDRKVNSFVPNEFLRLMGKRSIMDLKLGDHIRREMTVFFSDIRQFTEMFESISLEDGFKFINSYFTRVVPIINQYGGFVDKYIGDAIMAIFPQSNGADMAVRASVEIQKRFQEYNMHRARSGYRPLSVGIGIHTGMTILGVVGTHNRMQNTVISDAVNIASRIEGVTKTFGVSTAISGQTFRKLEHPEKYMFRYLGNVRVRGKSVPTTVYEILNGIDEEIKEKKIRTSRNFEQGLFSLALRKYTDALDNFAKVLSVIPEDRASAMYIGRCQERIKRA